MTPYYDHAGIQIYLGDCRKILPNLSCDLIITDPPYGINHPTNYKSNGRENLAPCTDYMQVVGDDKPFDPQHILAKNVPTVLWGGNWYSSRLPNSGGWLVWDKLRPDDLDQATCELAWTNFIKGVRRFSYLWNGMIRAGDEKLVHPMQKPIALTKWILSLKWTPNGTVIDPYMGSGNVLRACKDMGRPCIGIEIEEYYCRLAAESLSQEVLQF